MVPGVGVGVMDDVELDSAGRELLILSLPDSVLFLRPRDIVMPTKLANVLVAVVGEPTTECRFSGEEEETGICSEVVRRRPAKTFAKPSPTDWVGEGVDTIRFGLFRRPSVPLSLKLPFAIARDELDEEAAGDATGSSEDRAVVGAAFETPG